MTGTPENFEVSDHHGLWLQGNNVAVSLDAQVLHTVADQHGVSLDASPRVYVGDLVLPQSRANIMVHWPVPLEAFAEPDHQLQLTQAVVKSLLTVKREAWRHTANVWSIVTMLGGSALGAVGDYADYNVAQISGTVIGVAGGLSLLWANIRREPQLPPPEELTEHPVVLEPHRYSTHQYTRRVL